MDWVIWWLLGEAEKARLWLIKGQMRWWFLGLVAATWGSGGFCGWFGWRQGNGLIEIEAVRAVILWIGEGRARLSLRRAGDGGGEKRWCCLGRQIEERLKAVDHGFCESWKRIGTGWICLGQIRAWLKMQGSPWSGVCGGGDGIPRENLWRNVSSCKEKDNKNKMKLTG